MGTRRRPATEEANRASREPAGTATWYSDDNGQIACDEHRGLYGRMPWRRMSASDVIDFRAEVADCVGPDEAVCEVCRGNARRARQANMAATR